jgi:hypothetical protein
VYACLYFITKRCKNHCKNNNWYLFGLWCTIATKKLSITYIYQEQGCAWLGGGMICKCRPKLWRFRGVILMHEWLICIIFYPFRWRLSAVILFFKRGLKLWFMIRDFMITLNSWRLLMAIFDFVLCFSFFVPFLLLLFSIWQYCKCALHEEKSYIYMLMFHKRNKY